MKKTKDFTKSNKHIDCNTAMNGTYRHHSHAKLQKNLCANLTIEHFLEQFTLLIVFIIASLFASSLYGKIAIIIGASGFFITWYIQRIFQNLKIIHKKLQKIL